MKRLFATLFIMLFCTVTVFAAKDVDVTRTNIWGNFTYRAQLFPGGSGLFTKFSGRYNTSYKKEVDGTVTGTTTQGLWLSELFIGPEMIFKPSRKIKIKTTPMYRIMGYYVEEKKSDWTDPAEADPEAYYRQTVYWPTVFAYNFNNLTLSYRLSFWHLFPIDYVKAGADYHSDAEFYVRHMIKGTFHVTGKLDLYLGDEIFLLHTAQDEGEQFFWRNAVWTGVTYKPVSGTGLTLGYTHYYTRAARSPETDKDVIDHYVYFAVSYRSDYSNVSLLPY